MTNSLETAADSSNVTLMHRLANSAGNLLIEQCFENLQADTDALLLEHGHARTGGAVWTAEYTALAIIRSGYGSHAKTQWEIESRGFPDDRILADRYMYNGKSFTMHSTPYDSYGRVIGEEKTRTSDVYHHHNLSTVRALFKLGFIRKEVQKVTHNLLGNVSQPGI